MKIERNQWESEFFGREIGSLIFELEDHILPRLRGKYPAKQGVGGNKRSAFAKILQISPLRFRFVQPLPRQAGAE
ncbi:hypothetical protein A1D29_11205 [Pasteurellaceae bacterium Orientalotternb1]|nr:hypothetical protein A1D29_11205 [Pasteurellaceae bacterium Orientalotternb1]